MDLDLKTFPSIKLLNKCFTLGLSTPIIVNAANEVLVDLFLKGKIEYYSRKVGSNKKPKKEIFKKANFSINERIDRLGLSTAMKWPVLN